MATLYCSAGSQAVTCYTTSSNAATGAATDSWPAWNGYYVTCCNAATTGAAIDYWPAWNQAWYVSGNATATTSITIPTNVVWVHWIEAGDAARPQTQRLTADQAAAAFQQAVREEGARHEERMKNAAEANARAEKLLVAHLDEQQRAQYEKDRFFEVLATRSGQVRRYRLTHKWAGNVFLLDDHGREVAKFCIHPRNQVPIPDSLLAQKLLLETDEATFLRIANRTNLVAAAR